VTPLRRWTALTAATAVLGLVIPANPAASTTKAAVVAPAVKTPAKTVTITPTLASRLAAVKTAKSVNYYPSAAGWSRMWSSFDAARIDADLARAAGLGATNVRAIIFPYTFGYPAPKAEYTDKLARFVSLAAARGLTVRFTLFDWWGDYTDVTGSRSWATEVLKPYRNDPRVISVELQNEFKPTNTAGVAWAKKIVPAVRAAYPTMPLTFSVDGGSGATGMGQIRTALAATPVDYYDFHFYGNSERALATIRTAQAAVTPAPMVIGEVGLNTLQNTDGEQAAFLARVFEAAKVAGVQSVSPWTLTDFAAGAIPDSAVAKLPPQYHYGLYRTDGTAKPAATVVRAAFTGTAMPADLLDNGFEAATGQTPWRPYLPELGLAVKTQSAAHGGKWSVSFTRTGKNTSGSPSLRIAPIAPVQSGQKWHGEVWARGNAATGQTQIALSWFDAADKWLGGASSAALPAGTTNWTRLVVDGTAPAGAASMQVHLKSGDNSGTVWFDDVAVSWR
jgi:Cellulase (glycosyl hydrolase family 5)